MTTPGDTGSGHCDSSLFTPRAQLATVTNMEPVDRTSERLRDLLSDLDAKLEPGPSLTPTVGDARGWKRWASLLPTWAVLLVVTFAFIGISVIAVRPWNTACTHGPELCRIASIDIDALRLTVPDSELISMLPDIDLIDPDDLLTAGDVFDMERFDGLDMEQLLSQDEIDEVLGSLES